MEREVSTEESAYFSGSLQVKKKKKKLTQLKLVSVAHIHQGYLLRLNLSRTELNS